MQKDNYIIVEVKTKIIFNILDKVKQLDEDWVKVVFGIKNRNFSGKVKGNLFKKYELLKLLDRLNNIKKIIKKPCTFLILP